MRNSHYVLIINGLIFTHYNIDLYIGFRRSVKIHRLVELGIACLVYRLRSQSSACRCLPDGQYVQFAKGVGEALDIHGP